jgi:hypothetical protein
MIPPSTRRERGPARARSPEYSIACITLAETAEIDAVNMARLSPHAELDVRTFARLVRVRFSPITVTNASSLGLSNRPASL